MCLQCACMRGCIITLVASVWLYPTVCFQMGPQMAYLRRCIITLAAFVWLFSTVGFQMCPQMVRPRWCIVTLVAFVWLFSTVCHKMYPQAFCIGGCIFTLVAFILPVTVYFLLFLNVNFYELPQRTFSLACFFIAEIFIHLFSNSVVPTVVSNWGINYRVQYLVWKINK